MALPWGFVRLFKYRGFYYEFFSANGSTLLVLPIEITLGPPTYETSYLIENVPGAIDRFVFSRGQPLSHHYHALPFLKRLQVLWTLIKVVFLDAKDQWVKKKFTQLYFESWMMLLRWVLVQGWFFHCDFYDFLKKKCSKPTSYTSLISCHEMAFYAKIIWQVAKTNHQQGITAQHAMIYPEKLNFFPHPLEVRQAAMALPTVFYVFNEAMVEMLKPFYPKTKFLLACNPRYLKWKSMAPIPSFHVKRKILLVSAVMFYDVSMLLTILKNLIQEDRFRDFQYILRFHPSGEMRMRDRLWIYWARRFRNIEVSQEPLEKTLQEVALVIGSNTTTVQEAILWGVPVLTVFHEKYLCAHVLLLTPQWRIHVDALNLDRVRSLIATAQASDVIAAYKKFMGLDQPVFSIQQLVQDGFIGGILNGASL